MSLPSPARTWIMLPAALCLSVLALAPLPAQSDPAAHAAQARDAYRRAISALRAADSSAAVRALRTAAETWPAQPDYGIAFARLAARAGDTTGFASVIRRLAAQEAGAPLLDDAAVRTLADGDPTLQHARERFAAIGDGPERSAARVVSDDTLFFAEGLAADRRDGTLFITSVHHRNLLVVDAGGATRWLLPPDVRGRGAITGVALAPDGAHLWLATAVHPQMRAADGDTVIHAELLYVARANGAVVRRLLLGDGSGTAGELAVLADGTVLASDAVHGLLYRLTPGARAVQSIRSPLLRSPQGIAPSADERSAIVSDWSHGLLHWAFDGDVITPVATPDSVTLVGIDGLRRDDRRYIGVQNGVRPMRIVQIMLDASGRAVAEVETLDRPLVPRGEFTVGDLLGDGSYVYVASSAWPFWGADGARVAARGALPPVEVRVVRRQEADGRSGTNGR